MIKQRWHVFKWRRYLKKNRDGNHRCRNCGRSKAYGFWSWKRSTRHATWCWGPRGFHKVWVIIKRPKLRLIRIAWEAHKSELEWTGTEPWHRY